MQTPYFIHADVVLQGAQQLVARFESRSAVDIYFRRRRGMQIAGNVYVWAVMGSVRVLLGQAPLPVGNAVVTPGNEQPDATGALVLSLRNVMSEVVEVTTDGTSYLGDDGLAWEVDAYAAFSVVAYGAEPQLRTVDVSVVADLDVRRSYDTAWGHGAVLPPDEEGLPVRKLYQFIITSKSATAAWAFFYTGDGAETFPADGMSEQPFFVMPVPATSMVAVEFPHALLLEGFAWVLSSSPSTLAVIDSPDWRSIVQYEFGAVDY